MFKKDPDYYYIWCLTGELDKAIRKKYEIVKPTISCRGTTLCRIKKSIIDALKSRMSPYISLYDLENSADGSS